MWKQIMLLRPTVVRFSLCFRKGSHAMADSKKTLTHKQLRTIVALVTEPSIPKAAEVAKVGQRTIYDWMKQPEFKAALREARRESFTQAVSLAQRYAPLAMTTLAKVIADTSVAAHARVSAAIGILRFGREAIELDDLAGRIELLEQSAAEAAKK
jgi:pantoate kinase